jgi:hypothetical protein
MNYLEYEPGRVNLMFGVTSAGGIFGVSTEYYSGGGTFSSDGPSDEVLDYIYDRMTGGLDAAGRCVEGIVYFPAVVDP